MSVAQHLNSDKVEVFPVAKVRGDEQNKPGRTFTEDRMSNIIRQLLGNSSGFIVKWEKQEEDKYNIEFNLHGYYFRLSDFDPSDYGDDIYAGILIDDTTKEIEGQDEDPFYKGLYILDSIEEPPSVEGKDCEFYSLCIMKTKEISDGNKERVSPQSTTGFISTLAIGGIDGKH